MLTLQSSQLDHESNTNMLEENERPNPLPEAFTATARSVYKGLMARIRNKVFNTVYVQKYQANQSDPSPGSVMYNIKVNYDPITKTQHWYDQYNKCFKTIKVGI